MTLAPDLDSEREEIGYLLGRELALAEYAQKLATMGANGSKESTPNVTVVDRFWSLASTKPQRAYPTIYKLYNTYLHRLRRSRPDAAVRVASLMDEVRLRHAGAPPTLSREQQCLFACGYSQQTTALWAKRVPVAQPTDGEVTTPDPLPDAA